MVTDIAENIETCQQQIMHALEQRVTKQQSGLWLLASQPTDYRGAVKMAKNSEPGIRVLAVTIPQVFDTGRKSALYDWRNTLLLAAR